jgi:hypothetical protein
VWDSERRYSEAQMERAHANRVAAMGSFPPRSHEINQPIAAVVTNASAGLRWVGDHPLASTLVASSAIPCPGSIAHEVSQLLASIVTTEAACVGGKGPRRSGCHSMSTMQLRRALPFS